MLGIHILLMDEILHHLGDLNYCKSRDLRWYNIATVNCRDHNFHSLPKNPPTVHRAFQLVVFADFAQS